MASDKNYKEISEDALETEVAGTKVELQRLTFEKAIRGVSDTSQFKKMRQNVARSLTELRSRELAEYSAEELEMRSRIRARRARNKK
jgi:ribosomal protein L29